MFLTSKIWHHAHSTVTSSYSNSEGTHAAYEDVLFHENNELQTKKIDKNQRWTTFTSFLYVANCDSNASIGVTLGLLLISLSEMVMYDHLQALKAILMMTLTSEFPKNRMPYFS